MKLSGLEREIDDANYSGTQVSNKVSEYRAMYEEAITVHHDWIVETEHSFVAYLEELLDKLSPVMLTNAGDLHIPNSLPNDLKIEKKLNNRIRQKLNHREIFEG